MTEGRARRAAPIVASVRQAAARAGLQARDRLVLVGGTPPTDVLDVEMAAAERSFEVVVERRGRHITFHVEPERGEWHGLVLENGLGGPVRTCVNSCGFCFVDQMPPGLRPSLYVKDDDYRLSFLQGNFVTLSNLDDDDLARIERLRLSPLYVSLHAWDDEVRAALMGPAGRDARSRLLRLAEAGISLHVQIVLCPGVNDEEVLDETVRRLATVESVEDVGVVPVSLAREGRLRRVGPGEARRTLQTIERLRSDLEDLLGRGFVHAADELHLAAGSLPPAADATLQYENGIGVCAAFSAEMSSVAPDTGRAAVHPAERPAIRLLTGTLAAPVVAHACRRLPGTRPFVVENRLFGPHVTVTGLLGGRDVIRALLREPLAADEWLLAPRAFLPSVLSETLDGVAEEELSAACGGRLLVTGSVAEGIAAITGSRAGPADDVGAR